MPLPLALLGFLGPAKKFLTLKNIAIIAGAGTLIYFIWSYNSMREEIGALESKLNQQEIETTKAINNLNSCYAQVDSLNSEIVDLQKKHDETLNNALSKMQSICVRKDTVSNLNRKLQEHGLVPTEQKPQEVLDVEKSLNDRLNNRGFE